MSETPTSGFHRGQPVWVIDAEGQQRPAEYVGTVETATWFGGPPRVYVVYPDARDGEAVDADRVIPRDA